MVKFVQPILRHAQKLQSCVVVCRFRNVGLMLILSLLSRVGDSLVQRLDPGRQSLDLGLVLLDVILRCRNAGRQAAQLVGQLFALVLSLVDLGLAESNLFVVILLLLLQRSQHLVNEGQHLLEPWSLALKGQHDQIRRWCVAASSQHGKSPGGSLTRSRLNLQQTGRWQGLLEQFQSLIRIEQLDGVSDGHQFLAAILLRSVFILLALRTVGLQPGQVVLIGSLVLDSCLQVCFLIHSLDCKLP
mmetsp:Transcript_24577/g.59654  ORF Transcript_24577/g.59654 Transcript_24577/m.59654 type:complete len:244 (+) Transcript_24577:676-1407(+)